MNLIKFSILIFILTLRARHKHGTSFSEKRLYNGYYDFLGINDIGHNVYDRHIGIEKVYKNGRPNYNYIQKLTC